MIGRSAEEIQREKRMASVIYRAVKVFKGGGLKKRKVQNEDDEMH